MKLRSILVASLISVTALTAIGCSNDKVKDVPVSEIQAVVTTNKLLPQQSTAIDAKDHWMFENVKDSIVEGFVSQANINVKLQDVVVVKTTNPEAIVEALNIYKEESLRLFSGGYGGEDNATAVANSILETKGDYVYFIATPNPAPIEAKILEKIA